MSDEGMTTSAAVEAAFAGQFRRRFLREMWFPIAVTVASLTGPLFQFGFTHEAIPFVGNGLLFSVAIWGFSILSIQRDMARAKYAMTAGKMDEVMELEDVDAHWTWCEDSQSYAVHFTKNPHGDGSEETEESSEDAEDQQK